MRSAHKLVAASLLTAMLLMPLLGVALCAETATNTNCCGRGCPMGHKLSRIRSHSNGPQIADSAKRDCCAIKNSHPAPLTESQVVAPVVIALAPVAEATLPLTEREDAPVTCDTSPPGQSQARLCIFRI